MIFQRKIEGSIDTLSKKDKEPIKPGCFEEKDELAIILSGILVFLPIFIGLGFLLWILRP